MARLDDRIGPPSPASGRLDAALGGNVGMDTLNSMRGKKEQLANMQQQKTASAFDVLKSPESLIKLALALGGGLSGNKDLAMLGAGLGMGTLQAAPQVASEAKMQHIEQMDKLIGQIEKDRQVITQLMTQQPGLFLTDEGEDAVEPDMWRELMGLDVPLSPAAISKNRRLDQLQKDRLDFYGNMMDTAIESRNQPMMLGAMHGINELMGLELTPEQMQGFMQAEGPDEAIPQLFAYCDTQSVLDSLVNKFKNGGSVWSAQNNVLRPKLDNALDPIKDADAILVSEAIDMIRDTWNRMSPEEQNHYQERELGMAEFADHVLASSPVHHTAYMSANSAATRGDKLRELTIGHMLETTDTWRTVQSFGVLDQSLSPAQRARRKMELYFNIVNNMQEVRAVADVGRLGRVAAATPQHILDEALRRARAGEEVDFEKLAEQFIGPPTPDSEQP